MLESAGDPHGEPPSSHETPTSSGWPKPGRGDHDGDRAPGGSTSPRTSTSSIFQARKTLTGTAPTTGRACRARSVWWRPVGLSAASRLTA